MKSGIDGKLGKRYVLKLTKKKINFSSSTVNGWTFRKVPKRNENILSQRIMYDISGPTG